MTRRGIWLVAVVGVAVFAGVAATMLTLRIPSQCTGPAIKLTIGTDGMVTLDGRRLKTRRDIAAVFFASAEKRHQPSITLSADPHVSERTIDAVMTIARTAGLKCVDWSGTDYDSGV